MKHTEPSPEFLKWKSEQPEEFIKYITTESSMSGALLGGMDTSVFQDALTFFKKED